MSELKSCPFCGGEAFVRIDVALNQTQARYRVGCDKNPYCHGWYGHSRYYNTEAGAAAAWNTRHVETCEMHRDKYGVWHCSSCEKGADKITGSDGALESWNDSWPPNYCPYCGAEVVDE